MYRGFTAVNGYIGLRAFRIREVRSGDSVVTPGNEKFHPLKG
jgi:hypothetical protein